MNIMTIREGSTFELPITSDDDSAVSANLVVWNAETIEIVIDETESFIDGECTIVHEGLEEGDYEGLVVIAYSDGKIDVLPIGKPCDDDEECEYLEIKVCPGIPEGS